MKKNVHTCNQQEQWKLILVRHPETLIILPIVIWNIFFESLITWDWYWFLTKHFCGQNVFNSLTFFFYWRIIALQRCGGFCHTAMWLSQNYIYIYIYTHTHIYLLPLSLFSVLYSTPLGCHRARLGSLCYIATSS